MSATEASQQFIGGNKQDAKYDRQIRLWGKDGQQALAESHVIAVGVSASVAQALKSIVLTGVRAFTIVDDAQVTNEDIASNFFVLPEDKGQSLAASTARQLSELNSDCVSLALHMSPLEWVNQFAHATQAGSPCAVRKQLQALTAKATVVNANAVDAHGWSHDIPTLLLVSQRYTDHTEDSALVTAAKAAPGKPPVLCVQSRGLMGFYQAFAHDDLVITTPHPPQAELVRDLRIFNPFPALKAWFDAHDPSNPAQLADDIVQHSHIPYPSIIYRAYLQWSTALAQPATTPASPPPQPPLKPPQFREIQQRLWQMTRRKNPPQEAFIEASEKCNTSLNRPYQHIPSRSLVALWLNKLAFSPHTPPLPAHDEDCPESEERVALERALAWYVTRAIREFTVDHSPADNSYYVLPHCGHVPDFTATTQFFQELRHVYLQKHRDDAEDVARRAWTFLQEEEANRRALASFPENASLVRALLDKLSTTMVQNVWHLNVAPFASHDEHGDGTCEPVPLTVRERFGRCMAKHLKDEDMEPLVLATLSAVVLDAQSAGLAAPHDKEVVTDEEINVMATQLTENTSSMLCGAHPPRACEKVAQWYTEADLAAIRVACEELARVGKAQVPSVAATMGALAAQEAVKLMQRRRVPVWNPVVYSGYTNKLHVLTTV